MPTTTTNPAEHAGYLLGQVRTSTCSLHIISSSSEESFITRILDAIGILPTLTHDPREVGSFIETTSALLVQLGPSSELRDSGVATAVEQIQRRRMPWVLDTLNASFSAYRCDIAKTNLAHRPLITRSTPADIRAIMFRPNVSAATFAERFQTVSVACGDEILITDGVRSIVIHYGAPEMRNIRLLGSARSALCAAMASVEKDGYLAAQAALLITEVAAALAAESAKGPGSFSILLLDALASLNTEDIAKRGKLGSTHII